MRFANEVLMMFANEVCLLMRFSHQVPVNEVLAVFDDSIAYLHFLLGGWGGPSHQVDGGGHGMSNLISAELMRFAKEDIGSCKEGRAT